MYNKSCFCTTNEQCSPSSVPTSDSISGSASSSLKVFCPCLSLLSCFLLSRTFAWQARRRRASGSRVEGPDASASSSRPTPTWKYRGNAELLAHFTTTTVSWDHVSCKHLELNNTSRIRTRIWVTGVLLVDVTQWSYKQWSLWSVWLFDPGVAGSSPGPSSSDTSQNQHQYKLYSYAYKHIHTPKHWATEGIRFGKVKLVLESR